MGSAPFRRSDAAPAARTALRIGLPKIFCNYAGARHESRTRDLRLGKRWLHGAPECTKPDFAADGAIQGAQECTFGADSGGRSKDGGVPAVRIEEAIRALLAGDVETARRLLR